GHAGQLEHHASGLDDRDPALGRALAGAHAGLGRLLGVGLVRIDIDPDLAAALDLAGHRDTSGLDLTVGQPAGVHRLQAVLAELDLDLPAGRPGPAGRVVSGGVGHVGETASPLASARGAAATGAATGTATRPR